jgi:creatinine amidohydrolase
LAARADQVRDDIRRTLPDVDVSLSDAIARGMDRFTDMGMSRSYCGAPARATASHGDEMLARLADMIVGEVADAMGLGGG